MESTVSLITEALEDQEYAYLTTQGRNTGRPHRIEIWFVVITGTVWVNSSGRDRSDWVRNLIAEPRLQIEIGRVSWSALATLHPELGEHQARERLGDRYQGWQVGDSLSAWAAGGLLIEIVTANEH